ncbi:hypothetical protein BDZ89DRAFT_1037630 [Hymenopellis radicata]|nr:hypothetical protein BDZ89DRAFT_1037630 [Hymenopellis radicata]
MLSAQFRPPQHLGARVWEEYGEILSIAERARSVVVTFCCCSMLSFDVNDAFERWSDDGTGDPTSDQTLFGVVVSHFSPPSSPMSGTVAAASYSLSPPSCYVRPRCLWDDRAAHAQLGKSRRQAAPCKLPRCIPQVGSARARDRGMDTAPSVGGQRRALPWSLPPTTSSNDHPASSRTCHVVLTWHVGLLIASPIHFFFFRPHKQHTLPRQPLVPRSSLESLHLRMVSFVAAPLNCPPDAYHRTGGNEEWTLAPSGEQNCATKRLPPLILFAQWASDLGVAGFFDNIDGHVTSDAADFATSPCRTPLKSSYDGHISIFCVPRVGHTNPIISSLMPVTVCSQNDAMEDDRDYGIRPSISASYTNTDEALMNSTFARRMTRYNIKDDNAVRINVRNEAYNIQDDDDDKEQRQQVPYADIHR